jgi:hypothetical protein
MRLVNIGHSAGIFGLKDLKYHEARLKDLLCLYDSLGERGGSLLIS